VRDIRGLAIFSDYDKERYRMKPAPVIGITKKYFSLQSREKLTKHNNMSDLHKQNLEEWKKAQQ
jgi:hypothetical protein